MGKLKLLLKLLDQLNSHYGKNVSLKYRTGRSVNAHAHQVMNTIHILGFRFLHPQVLAHEYTHFVFTPYLAPEHSNLDYDGLIAFDHPAKFFAAYKRVCRVIKIKPMMVSIETCENFTDKLIRRQAMIASIRDKEATDNDR